MAILIMFLTAARRGEILVGRSVRAGLVQAEVNVPGPEAVAKQVAMIVECARQGASVVCLQELFHGPYFCAEQDPCWFGTAEPDDGLLVRQMRRVARAHGIVLVVPFYEKERDGVYYSTAIVIDADGSVVGKYRKSHIPQLGPCYWEKYFFKPGNLGYPAFDTAVGRIGVSICYDRHFPEVGRALGLAGAEIVFNPSATSDYSRYLWQLEQPAQAVANGYFVGAVNRVGVERLSEVRFFGASYFCDPRGQIIAQAREGEDDILIADLDLDLIGEVKQLWQFYRDRRPETYEFMVTNQP
jgi:beta-ureidopropionase